MKPLFNGLSLIRPPSYTIATRAAMRMNDNIASGMLPVSGQEAEKIYKTYILPFLQDLEKRPLDFGNDSEGVFAACDYIEKQWDTGPEALNYEYFATHDMAHKAVVMRIMDICDHMIWQVQSELIRAHNNIWVSSVYDVKDMVDSHKIEAVLSIEHPNAPKGGGKAPRIDSVTQHIECFWDTENPDLDDAPTVAHIQRALDFLELSQHKNVLIHCKAGKSRSVAIALAHMAKTCEPEEAIARIKKMRPNAAPNLLVVDIADGLLGFNGKLTRAVEADAEFTKRREAIRRELKDLVYSPDLERRL